MTPAPPRIAFATLREWFAVAADAMLAVDPDGRIVACNAHACELFGYADAELRNQPVELLVPERLRRRHRAHREAYLAAPRPRMVASERELVGRRRDGAQFPVGITLTPVLTERGPHVVTSVRDVSDTWRGRQVRERARRNTFVMQIGRLAVESTDYELAIRRTPEMVARALNVGTVAVFSTDWRHSEPRIRASVGLDDRAASALTATFGEARFIRVTFGHRGLEAITTDTLHAPAFDAVRTGLAAAGFLGIAMVPLFGHDEPLGAIAVLTPTPSGFDHDQVAFLQSVANLLAAAVQRSRSEEQLAHVHRLDAIGQLTGGIAHDFNNLLTIISGNLQLLEAELPDQPDLQATIASALGAVERGAALTHRLLAYARRQPLQPRAVVPQPLVQELGHMLRRTLGESIAVEVECAADVPDVHADPNELDTALVNLALNARDAMPRGGRLRLAARTLQLDGTDPEWHLRAGRYVVFSVQDTGVGIAPDVRARVFEPFVTTKDPGKGSGLGLSMVYGFVTQSGGAITIDSRLGYGTRVAFALPAATAANRPALDAAPAPHADSSSPGATILVVEDEPLVRDVAVRFLAAIGYTVLAAGSADEAMRVLQEHPGIDLLFSDVVLGRGMNGVELAGKARRLCPGLAVLLTSGYEGDTGIAAGSDYELLHKPYRREQLIDAIQRLLPG